MAIGRQAQQQLAEIGISSIGIRHPAHGGASLFRKQLQDLMAGRSKEG